MRLKSFFLGCSLSIAVAGCGGSDSGPGLQCGSVPACYTDALAALRACVAAPALTLMPVAPMSGTINGLRCSAGDVSVAFSTFSSSPTGVVPLPSTVTVNKAGSLCAELKSGTGTRTDNTGASLAYEISTIRVASGSEVSVNTYEDGSIGVTCAASGPGSEEVIASAGALDSCPSAVLVAQVVRNDNVTHMGVDLLDPSGGRTTLFTCD